MKIYLDNCSLQRPLDSKTQIRISLEAEAILGVLDMVAAGDIELVSSEILQYEISKSSRTERKLYALNAIALANTSVPLSDGLISLAHKIIETGIKPIDAMHLAAAETAGADFFCTCDDSFLKKAKAMTPLSTKVVSPIELVQELEQ